MGSDIIHTFQPELAFEGEQPSLVLSNGLGETLLPYVYAALEQVCDELSDEWGIRIDRVDINLGNFDSFEMLSGEITERLASELHEVLLRHTIDIRTRARQSDQYFSSNDHDRASPNLNHEGNAGDDPRYQENAGGDPRHEGNSGGDPRYQENAGSDLRHEGNAGDPRYEGNSGGDLEIVEQFLLHGDLPWWADRGKRYDWPSLVKRLEGNDRSKLAAMIAARLDDDDIYRRLRHVFKGNTLPFIEQTSQDITDTTKRSFWILPELFDLIERGGVSMTRTPLAATGFKIADRKKIIDRFLQTNAIWKFKLLQLLLAMRFHAATESQPLPPPTRSWNVLHGSLREKIQQLNTREKRILTSLLATGKAPAPKEMSMLKRLLIDVPDEAFVLLETIASPDTIHLEAWLSALESSIDVSVRDVARREHLLRSGNGPDIIQPWQVIGGAHAGERLDKEAMTAPDVEVLHRSGSIILDDASLIPITETTAAFKEVQNSAESKTETSGANPDTVYEILQLPVQPETKITEQEPGRDDRLSGIGASNSYDFTIAGEKNIVTRTAGKDNMDLLGHDGNHIEPAPADEQVAVTKGTARQQEEFSSAQDELTLDNLSGSMEEIGNRPTQSGDHGFPITSGTTATPLVPRAEDLVNEKQDAIVPENSVIVLEATSWNYLRLQDDLTTRHTRQDKWIVGNAGLCIIANYLPAFFRAAGLTEGKEFCNYRARVRAIGLLEYLAWGRQQHPEFLLQLNKILCGLQPESTVVPPVRLRKKDVKEAGELLQAVIDHWKALRNTSVEGLRTTFIQRQGILRRQDDGFILQVESSGIDVLLDRLPWTYNTIKLPWMKQVLRVEW